MAQYVYVLVSKIIKSVTGYQSLNLQLVKKPAKFCVQLLHQRWHLLDIQERPCVSLKFMYSQ